MVKEEGSDLPQHGLAVVPAAPRRSRGVVELLDDGDVLASAAVGELQRPAEAALRGDEPRL